MKFGEELDRYVVLKLHLDQYRGSARALGTGFKIAASGMRESIRKEEKRLLKLYFPNWEAPYFSKLKGWRTDSPVFMLYQGRLVSGLYLCVRNEFDEDRRWGQLHYFFTDPEFKKRGLHSILLREAIRRAKSWNLQGVIINTDRHFVPEVYERWGAIPCKEIRKASPQRVPFASVKNFIRRARRLVYILTRYILNSPKR